MRYWLRNKYPCPIGPAWGNSEETGMSCLIRLTCCNARSVSCEPDLFPLLFQAVRLFPFYELYPTMGYSFHNILFPDVSLMQRVWFGVFCMLLPWWWNSFILLQLCMNVLWLIQGRGCGVHFLLLQRRRKQRCTSVKPIGSFFSLFFSPFFLTWRLRKIKQQNQYLSVTNLRKTERVVRRGEGMSSASWSLSQLLKWCQWWFQLIRYGQIFLMIASGMDSLIPWLSNLPREWCTKLLSFWAEHCWRAW